MRNYSILLFALLLASCTSGNTNTAKVETIEIDIPTTETPEAKLSDFASSVETVSLETNDSTLINEPLQIISQEDFIYVADNAGAYKFDSDGKLLASILRKGVAPEEYISLTDFAIDSNGDIWILSRNNKALYNYAWNGTLLQKIDLNAWVLRIAWNVPDKEMLLYIGNEKDETNQHQLCVLNINTKEITRRMFPIDDDKANYLHIKSTNHFSQENERKYFYQMFNDTIYAGSNNGSFIPAYVLDLDGKNIPSSFYQHKYNDVMDFFQHLFKGNYAYGTKFFLKKGKDCWTSFIYGGHSYWYLSKGGKKQSCNTLVENVCLAGYKICLDELEFFVQNDGCVIIPIYPYLIAEYAEKYLKESERHELLQKIRYVNEEQNPILLKIVP